MKRPFATGVWLYKPRHRVLLRLFRDVDVDVWVGHETNDALLCHDVTKYTARARFAPTDTARSRE